MEISLEYQPFIGQHEYPAVSILVPTHPKYPEFKVDREHMIALVSQAEDLLRAGYSKKLADSMLDRLYDTVNQINYTHLTEGLAVYVSPHHSKVIRLPFAVKEKVIVDTSFEFRDLIQAAKMNREYLLVMVTRNGVRTLLGYGKSFGLDMVAVAFVFSVWNPMWDMQYYFPDFPWSSHCFSFLRLQTFSALILGCYFING